MRETRGDLAENGQPIGLRQFVPGDLELGLDLLALVDFSCQ